jgi:glycosyltransferase involved in cell wall biosynthesis
LQTFPNVELIGYNSFNDLRDQMQRSKAFAFAALENFGIPPPEAKVYGTPVIAL